MTRQARVLLRDGGYGLQTRSVLGVLQNIRGQALVRAAVSPSCGPESEKSSRTVPELPVMEFPAHELLSVARYATSRLVEVSGTSCFILGLSRERTNRRKGTVTVEAGAVGGRSLSSRGSQDRDDGGKQDGLRLARQAAPGARANCSATRAGQQETQGTQAYDTVISDREQQPRGADRPGTRQC